MAMADTIKKIPADPIPLADGRVSSAEINFRRVDDNKLLLSFNAEIRSFNLVMLFTCGSSSQVHEQSIDSGTDVVDVAAVVDGAGVVVVTAKFVFKKTSLLA